MTDTYAPYFKWRYDRIWDYPGIWGADNSKPENQNNEAINFVYLLAYMSYK